VIQILTSVFSLLGMVREEREIRKLSRAVAKIGGKFNEEVDGTYSSNTRSNRFTIPLSRSAVVSA
jgi:hypothetical protein